MHERNSRLAWCVFSIEFERILYIFIFYITVMNLLGLKLQVCIPPVFPLESK